MRTHGILALALVLCTLTGCPSQPTRPAFDTGTTGHDAATNDAASPGSDAGRDASMDAASAIDAAMAIDSGVADDAATTTDAGDDAASAIDANASDAGSDAGNDAGRDAGSDAATDAGHDGGSDAGPVTCMSAGGMCVALSPGACPAPGVVGDATHYTCGGGLGTECCLPGTPSTAPVCMFTGTAMEGWYQADGTLICTIACAGLTARCQRIGTPSQGWYTTSGHGCPPHTTEILNDPTCM